MICNNECITLHLILRARRVWHSAQRRKTISYGGLDGNHGERSRI